MKMGAFEPSNPENRYRYNGKEFHTESDLDWYDYGARMYDPSIGRFNSVDPQTEKFVTLTPYNYVSNNPLVFIDPTGEELIFIFSADSEEKREEDRLRVQRYINNGLGGAYTANISEKGVVTLSKNEDFEGDVSEGDQVFINAFLDATDSEKSDVTIDMANGVPSPVGLSTQEGDQFVDVDQLSLFEGKELAGPESMLLHEVVEATKIQRKDVNGFLPAHNIAREAENKFQGILSILTTNVTETSLYILLLDNPDQLWV